MCDTACNACTVNWQRVHIHVSRQPLSDNSLIASVDVADRLDKYHFLFRDAANKTALLEPVSKTRTKRFWYELLWELEKRLEKEGITNNDGSRISLITYWQDTRPRGTIFDQHSLRVTGLTTMAGAGVPIHMLREFVAGHATILMTLYYLRPRAGEITRVLDEALSRTTEDEQQDWSAYLQDQPLEVVREVTAYNSEDGLLASKQVQSALWAPTEYGVCPNSATKCSEGGPFVEGKGKRKIHSPVPGGAYNCAMCRFFVTGPPFLGGLVAKFNETVGQLLEKVERLRQQEAGL